MTLDEFRELTKDMPGRTHLTRLGVDKSLIFLDARPSKASLGGFNSCGGRGNFFYENVDGRLSVIVLEDE